MKTVKGKLMEPALVGVVGTELLAAVTKTRKMKKANNSAKVLGLGLGLMKEKMWMSKSEK